MHKMHIIDLYAQHNKQGDHSLGTVKFPEISPNSAALLHVTVTNVMHTITIL